MKRIPFEPGRVVLSKQGHDKGRLFLVVGLADEKHVFIADGSSRTLEKPKKKQTKHLHAKPAQYTAISGTPGTCAPPGNSEIRKALKAFENGENL